MQEGFIKYGRNEVVQISQITCIWENGIAIRFSTTELSSDENFWSVEPKYEKKWRDLFDLND